MRINTQKLYDNYKDIEKECIENGEVIPYLISPIHIPDKYRLSLEELNNIKADKKTYSEELNNIKADKKTYRENYIKHRTIENEIIQKKNKKYKTLTDYWADQLKNFFKTHPHFEEKVMEK